MLDDQINAAWKHMGSCRRLYELIGTRNTVGLDSEQQCELAVGYQQAQDDLIEAQIRFNQLVAKKEKGDLEC